MVGRVTTEGDRAIGSNLVRRRFQIDGKGITIGIISDSFDAFGEATANVRSGDLPGRGNPNGYTTPVRVLRDLRERGVVDEGRAMAQILFDIAPGARLLFHTTGETEEDFAAAIQTLTDAGADIIVDDILFATAPFFQDGIGAQAVDRAVERGVVYVSAAGNSGTRSYDSPFRSSRTFTFRGSTYAAHDFDPTDGVDPFQAIQVPADRGVDLILHWDQAIGQVNTDFELFLLDQEEFPEAGSIVLESGEIVRRRGDAPSKRISYSTSSAQTVYLVVARRITEAETEGAPSPADPSRIKWISFAGTADGTTLYEYVNDTPSAIGSSTIYGHQNADGSIAVGAVPFRSTPRFGGNSPVLESFSSSGGVPILFSPTGDRFTTPEQRQKPQLLAPNRVSTTVLGFSSFGGTSAAAPHVAAVAALLLQRAGGRGRLTPTQVLALLQQTAIPVELPEFNLTPGFIRAYLAVLNTFQTQQMGTDAADVLVGSEDADNLYGLAGDDRLEAGAGIDALVGGRGNDTLQGDRGNDYLLGQAGRDLLVGDRAQDVLVGGAGRDTLQGGAGQDNLRGGAGSDWLQGAGDHNQLWGGGGADRFWLDRRGLAQIQDFQDQLDRLVLPQGLPFRQVTIDFRPNQTVIQWRDRDLAVLRGISDSLTAQDFVAASARIQ